jgi:hypothetical protein
VRENRTHGSIGGRWGDPVSEDSDRRTTPPGAIAWYLPGTLPNQRPTSPRPIARSSLTRLRADLYTVLAETDPSAGHQSCPHARMDGRPPAGDLGSDADGHCGSPIRSSRGYEDRHADVLEFPARRRGPGRSTLAAVGRLAHD